MADTLLPKDLVDAVEGNLQRATLSGMRVHTAVGRSETGASRFSIESILRYCDIAAVLLAARVQANSVRPLFDTRTPIGDGYFLVSDALRLRGVSPNLNGTLARRRTRVSNEYYTDRGADPTSEEPAFVFEGGEFFIEGDTKNPTTAQADFIGAPLTNPNSESAVTLSGTTLSTSAPTKKHEQTIAYLVDSSTGDEYSARITGTNSTDTEVDSKAPDSDYDVTYFDHACAQLGVRHQTAIAEMASAFCFASLGEGDTLEAALSNFSDEVRSDLLPAFDLSEQNDDS